MQRQGAYQDKYISRGFGYRSSAALHSSLSRSVTSRRVLNLNLLQIETNGWAYRQNLEL